MKKRLLCFLLAIMMVLSLVLTSCKDEKTDDEIRKENVCAGDTAYTLSLWIPTNSDSNSDAFKKRLEAVEEEINSLIATKNTKINIIAVSDAEYDAKLSEKFNSIKASTLAKPIEIGKTYVNDAEKYPPNSEDYFYKLKYPEILENQIDICLIRDYATYTKLANDGMLYSLNPYVTSESASYPRFKKLIRNEIITPLVINKNLYAVPNNRAYADDSFQYVLINKALVEASGYEFDLDSITSVLDCEELINAIGEAGTAGVVPFVGTEKDAPGIIYWADEQSLITSADGTVEPGGIFDNEAYMAYTSLYKSLKDKNYVKNALGEGEKAGVMIYNGTKAGAEAYANDYYLVKTGNPVMTEEDVYGSMFAISEYSINYDRAMSFLYMLYTNTEIRTLLQYGIKDTDYELDYSENEDDPKIKLIKDANGNVVYNMNNDYTGNGYKTYREDGTVIDDWDYVKSVNYDATVSNYLHFLSNYNKSASATQKTKVDALVTALKALNAEIFAEISAMTSDEFEAFKVAYEASKGFDVIATDKKLADGLEEYNTLKPDEQTKKDKIEANKLLIEEYKGNTEKAEEVKTLEDENKALQAELDKISAYDKLLEDKAIYSENATVYKLLSAEIYKNALSEFTSLNSTYNK